MKQQQQQGQREEWNSNNALIVSSCQLVFLLTLRHFRRRDCCYVEQSLRRVRSREECSFTSRAACVHCVARILASHRQEAAAAAAASWRVRGHGLRKATCDVGSRGQRRAVALMGDADGEASALSMLWRAAVTRCVVTGLRSRIPVRVLGSAAGSVVGSRLGLSGIFSLVPSWVPSQGSSLVPWWVPSSSVVSSIAGFVSGSVVRSAEERRLKGGRGGGMLSLSLRPENQCRNMHDPFPPTPPPTVTLGDLEIR